MRRVLPGSNTSESKVVQLNYSVDPSWIIPMMEVPANHAGTREHKVQWVSWLTLGMSTFESILSDWDEGLTMKCGAKLYKLAPLRVLEDTKLRDYWRSGPTVNKSVLFYKSLVYMILRLVVGLPRNKSDAGEGRRHAPMTVDEAIVHVKQSEYPQQQRVYKKASQVP
ncbi:hypothetical protein CEUSTIGMA_g6147.t1 [Chlamydomonas eustigma]|uniref:Uncharacterized protein n=1 Tax=Chlamydomonas eustigma TaxID=1157962 RepID=A0A250X718_9CHLO|nr:hypothetical protein CEUSTIGMA_g6147.t1 [Chlamydomonas eustigma]|eukprot:GAX78709.1 hypothetical protein CEUSTIGMA_g6147.t1 [Chlamydomonas eustigma]